MFSSGTKQPIWAASSFLSTACCCSLLLEKDTGTSCSSRFHLGSLETTGISGWGNPSCQRGNASTHTFHSEKNVPKIKWSSFIKLHAVTGSSDIHTEDSAYALASIKMEVLRSDKNQWHFVKFPLFLLPDLSCYFDCPLWKKVTRTPAEILFRILTSYQPHSTSTMQSAI